MICEEEGWTLEAAGFDQTHGHFLVFWRGFYPWEHLDYLKRTYLPGHRGLFWQRSMELPKML